MLITPIYLQAAEEKAAAEAAAKVRDSVILEANGALKEVSWPMIHGVAV